MSKIGKASKKITIDSNFYFTTINLIKQGKNLQDIADHFNVSKQLLNYHILPLKALNIINKRGLVWLINKKNLSKLNYIPDLKKSRKLMMGGRDGDSFTNQPNTIRGHGYQFSLKTPEIKNIKQRLKRHSPYEIKGGVGLILQRHKINIYKETIRIYFPEGKSYLTEKPIIAFFMALYDCKLIIKRLERLLNRKLSINRQYWIKPTKQHYGLIKSDLAIQLEKEGKKLTVRDKKGKIWMLVDNSFNFQETEFIDNIKSIDDSTVAQKNFNLIRNLSLKEIIDNQKRTNEALEYMDKNIQKLTKLVYKQGNYDF